MRHPTVTTRRTEEPDYEWLTVTHDGFQADMTGTTPAEMDRRVVIVQELRAGRLVLGADHRGARRAASAVKTLRDQLARAVSDTRCDALLFLRAHSHDAAAEDLNDYFAGALGYDAPAHHPLGEQ